MMKNIILAQLYKLYKKPASIRVFIILLVFDVLALWQGFLWQEVDTVSESIVEYGYSEIYSIFALAWAMFIMYMILGDDVTNRTLFLELSTGKSRFSEIISRFLIGYIVSVLGTLIMYFLPVTLCIQVHPWGDTIELQDFVLRGLLIQVAMFDFCAIVLMFLAFSGGRLTFILSGAFMAPMMPMVLSEMFPDLVCPLVSVFSMARLINFKVYSIYTITNMNTIDIYSSAIEPAFAFEMLISSLALGSLLVVIAYEYFRKTDF